MCHLPPLKRVRSRLYSRANSGHRAFAKWFAFFSLFLRRPPLPLSLFLALEKP